MSARHIFADLTDGLKPVPQMLDDMFADIGASGSTISCTAGGTANAITLTEDGFAPRPTAYADGMQFAFAGIAASTAAVTVAFRDLGMKNLYHQDGTTAVGVDIIQSGAYYVVSYESALNGGAGGFYLANGPLPRFATLTRVNLNTSPLPTPATGTVLQLGNADESTTRLSIFNFGTVGVPNVTFQKSRGTAAAPTAVQSSDLLGSMTWNARGATAYASSGRAVLQAVATENWTDSAQGTKLEVHTTPTGGTSTAKVFEIGDGGTVAITPTASSFNLGVNITQSSLASAGTLGPFDANKIVFTSNARMLGTTPSADAPWHDRVSAALKIRQDVGANASGFQIPLILDLRHETATDLWRDGSCDFVAFTIHAYSNASDGPTHTAGAGFYASAPAARFGPLSTHADACSINPTIIAETGATLRSVTGVKIQKTAGVASILDTGSKGIYTDTAISCVAYGNSWENLITFGDEGSLGTTPPITDNIMHSLFAFDVVNFFDLSNLGATGSFVKFDDKVDWLGTGFLTITANSTSGSVINVQNANTGGVASFTAQNDTATLIDFGVRGSLRAAFGDLVGNNAYVLATGATGLMLMASNASGPVRFSAGGNTEDARFTPSGGLNVGATTDISSGVISAATGFRVANAAAAGNRLRGNGTNFISSAIGVDLGQCGYIVNGTIVESHAANAATYAVKTLAGADPSASDPVYFVFRSSTAATGTYVVRAVTAALSITITASATLGHASAIAQQVFGYAIDNAGTVELGVSNKFFDQSQRLVTTTTMSAAATSTSTMYSTTGRSNVPFIPIFRAVSNQPTAGTWTVSPTLIDLAPFTLPTNHVDVNLNANQTGIVTSTFTKVTMDTEASDPDGVFDNATNYRYQPNVAGKYLVLYTATFSDGSDGALELFVVYKNGVDTYRGLTAVLGAALGTGGPSAVIVDMNGTSDYLEFYVWQNSGSNKTVLGGSKFTGVRAQRIGP